MIGRLFLRLALTAAAFAMFPFGIVFMLLLSLLLLAGALEKIWQT